MKMAIAEMAGQPTDADAEAADSDFDWSLVAIIVASLDYVLIAVLAVAGRYANLSLSQQTQDYIGYGGFAVAVVAPVALCWARAVRIGKLPVRRNQDPKYEHISGWGAILLFAVILVIVVLVWWAATSEDGDRKIHALWGLGVVIGVAIAFIGVAIAPAIPRFLRSLKVARSEPEAHGDNDEDAKADAKDRSPIRALGRRLSELDSVLVFAVANAGGANRSNILLRYAILVSAIGSSAALGYFWPAPWGLFPIAWGFLLAFAISRRWAWIEDDRELAMLNPHLPDAYVRVGFDQNLRDEALLSFLSMFLLVPLALRQFQLLATEHDVAMFTFLNGSNVHSMLAWISFYGTELAKAVPFVDWAEVYHVEGEANIRIASDLGRHAIFATRILIDLVFLAALLQAIANASRDAQQRELFYVKQVIPRLDPFTEPDALKALVIKNDKGEWVGNGERFERFPKYDPNRLVALLTSKDGRLRAVADKLLSRDRVESDPYHKLSSESADHNVQPERLDVLINDVEQLDKPRNVFLLDLARQRLLRFRGAMVEQRRRILRLIVATPHSKERTERLIVALMGESREPTYQNRWVALEGLTKQLAFDARVRSTFEYVAKQDGAETLQRWAQDLLDKNPEQA
jgi:hypothetical protein